MAILFRCNNLTEIFSYSQEIYLVIDTRAVKNSFMYIGQNVSKDLEEQALRDVEKIFKAENFSVDEALNVCS